MDWLLEPFRFEFVRQALLAGVLAAVTTSLVGTWVVLRGLSLLGDALAHGVLPGVALALLIGVNPLLGAAASALLMIGGINLVHRRARLSEDVGIGLLFAGMLALGVVLISRSGSYTGSLTGILFGDALGITSADIATLAWTAGAALVASLLLFRSFLVLSFNEEKAVMLGLRPRLAHLAMLGLVTAAVTVSFRTIGTLLVFALLVAPPATASLMARRLPTIVAAAVAVGTVAVLVGLLVSYHADTAAGATIAVVAVAMFFVVLTTRRLVPGVKS